MTTQTPIQKFADEHKWEGDAHRSQVWIFKDDWEKVLDHNSPYDAAPHFVYESHAHTSMLVMTGVAQQLNGEDAGMMVGVRIFVYIDKGSIDYKTAFEIDGEIVEDTNPLEGAYTEFLSMAMSKRDLIVHVANMYGDMVGEDE